MTLLTRNPSVLSYQIYGNGHTEQNELESKYWNSKRANMESRLGIVYDQCKRPTKIPHMDCRIRSCIPKVRCSKIREQVDQCTANEIENTGICPAVTVVCFHLPLFQKD